MERSKSKLDDLPVNTLFDGVNMALLDEVNEELFLIDEDEGAERLIGDDPEVGVLAVTSL